MDCIVVADNRIVSFAAGFGVCLVLVFIGWVSIHVTPD